MPITFACFKCSKTATETAPSAGDDEYGPSAGFPEGWGWVDLPESESGREMYEVACDACLDVMEAEEEARRAEEERANLPKLARLLPKAPEVYAAHRLSEYVIRTALDTYWRVPIARQGWSRRQQVGRDALEACDTAYGLPSYRDHALRSVGWEPELDKPEDFAVTNTALVGHVPGGALERWQARGDGDCVGEIPNLRATTEASLAGSMPGEFLVLELEIQTDVPVEGVVSRMRWPLRELGLHLRAVQWQGCTEAKPVWNRWRLFTEFLEHHHG